MFLVKFLRINVFHEISFENQDFTLKVCTTTGSDVIISLNKLHLI